MRILISLLVAFFVVNCSTSKVKKAPQTTDPKEYRLGKDRSEFDEIRKGIDVETKSLNDDMATVLALFKERREPPDQIRSKFYDLIRKKREKFENSNRKDRDNFDKAERGEREKFLSAQKKARDLKIRAKDVSGLRDLVRDQSTERESFFSDQRERRKDFDSILDEKRSTFRTYVKDWEDRFLSEIKEYIQIYKETKQAEELKKKFKSKSGADIQSGPEPTEKGVEEVPLGSGE